VNKKNVTKIALVFCGTIIAGIFIGIDSSRAITISNFFGSVLKQVNNELSQAENALVSDINKWTKVVSQPAQQAVSSNTGTLGAVDPILSSQQLKTSLSGTLSLPVASKYAQSLERSITKNYISTVLGSNGQQNAADKINNINQTAQTVQDEATNAQNLTASQDVLKVLTNQNAQIASLLAQSRADSIQFRQDTMQNSLMLHQIAQYAADQQNAQNLKDVGTTALINEISGLMSLSPTHNSQSEQ
jgi:hypothetical protein